MVHGVIAHSVAFLHHPLYQIGVFLNVVAHQKEGSGHIVGLQHIQNLSGAAVFVARVEGQVQHLFLRVSDVGRIVPGQLVPPGVADGRHPLLPEAQAPGAGFQRAASENADGDRRGDSQCQQ